MIKRIDQVCVIDDDAILRSILKIYIKNDPAFGEVIEYANGKIAYDALKTIIENNTALPNVIILDLNMPVMDGWQFLEEYSKLEGALKVPVIVLSSSINQHDFDKAKTFSAVKDFIVKPINKDSIERIISKSEI